MTATRALVIFCVGLLIAQRPYSFAQQPQATGGTGSQPQRSLTAAQLDSLVAPIALYPDPILSQVLVASTYPLEVVEAGRWVKQQSNLSGKALADAAAKQPWDASVQALVLLPDVLKRLDQDITWTSDLGNAFLANQQDVLEAVQRMRKRASDSGALQTTKEQTVSTATENNQAYIEIQPTSTDVVYVPQYNPVAVWGPPPEYYPYPPIYYPPYSGAAIAAGAISFGVGVAVGAIISGGWNNWGWNTGWGRNNIVVNNNFINHNHFNRVNTIGSNNNWVHNPGHRGGVPYNNRAVADRFQGAGNRVATRPSVAQTQQGLTNLSNRGGNLGGRGGQPGQGALGQSGIGSANRMAPGNLGGRGGGQPGQGALRQPGIGSANRVAPGNVGGDRIGNRNLQRPSQSGAFGGLSQGGNRAFQNSNRGFSSSGGGFRGGGGGGSRGGGGGFRGGGGGSRGGGRRR